MDFNDRTKIAIENAFLALLDDMPFKKITVQNILDRCGCSRPTFYYHFRDKYAVVGSIYNHMISPVVDQFPQITWVDMVESIYEKLNENLNFARQTLDYNEQGPVVTYLVEYDIEIYKQILKQHAGLKNIDENLMFQIRFHSMACVGNMAYWLQKDERETPRQMALKLLDAMPHNLYNILPNRE